MTNLPVSSPEAFSILRSGQAFAVLDMAAISFAVVLPLTLYRALYSISLGYGGSVAALGLALNFLFKPSTSLTKSLIAVTIVYGFRLAGYLCIRDFSGWKPDTKISNRLPVTKSIGLALSVSILYAAMVSPVLYVVQNPPLPSSQKSIIAWTGVALSWCGATMEAVADQHKSVVKQKHRMDSSRKPVFVGPSNGLYSIVRHPNYLGEIIFWSGLWVAGLPSYQTVWSRWMWSTTGLIGILSIMFGSSKRLENQQKDKYSGQVAYEKWKQEVPYPMIPFMKDVPRQVVPLR